MLSQGRNYMGNDVLLGKVEGNCMAGSSFCKVVGESV